MIRWMQGSSGIAGLAGFMSFDVSPEQIPERMKEGTCFEIISKIIGAIIAFLNPEQIVLSGELIHEAMVDQIRNYCSKSVPPQFLPEFIIVPEFGDYLMRGLFCIAVQQKIFL